MKRFLMLGVLLVCFNYLAFFEIGNFELSFDSESTLHATNLTPYHSEITNTNGEKLKRVSIKLKAYADDVAAVRLLVVEDEKGDQLLQKYVENTHCSTINFHVSESASSVTVFYGDTTHVVYLNENKGYLDLRPARS